MCSRRKVIVSDTSFERPFSFLYHFYNFFWNTINQIKKCEKRKKKTDEKGKRKTRSQMNASLEKNKEIRKGRNYIKRFFFKSSCWRAQY